VTGLGARIAAARAHASLSQATLGHRLGVTQTAVSYWESDQREPGLAELIGLARELGVTLAHLAGSDTSEAESYWVGFRAGWLACADNVTAAAALNPARFPAPPRERQPDEWVTVDGRPIADRIAIPPDAVIDAVPGALPEAGDLP
jgi:transcriptional regulator with XRE-family HTH domain